MVPSMPEIRVEAETVVDGRDGTAALLRTRERPRFDGLMDCDRRADDSVTCEIDDT